METGSDWNKCSDRNLPPLKEIMTDRPTDREVALPKEIEIDGRNAVSSFIMKRKNCQGFLAKKMKEAMN